MRLVFDTNVIVAGIVAEGLCRELLEVHVPEHTAILSDDLWNELVSTLRRKFGLTPDDLPILALYRQQAVWCEPVDLGEPVCRDPDDDRVLATARAGEAEAIVTGDADLLTLGTYSGVKILSPRDLLIRLGPPPGR